VTWPQETNQWGDPFMNIFIGLDVHSKCCVYVAQNESGKDLGTGRVDTTPDGLAHMLRTLRAPTGTSVALESGPSATWVSRQLTALGMKPVVIDAHEVRAKALRPNQKSDLRDARELCEGLRRNLYQSIVYIPDPTVERLRLLVSRRRHFVGISTRQINAAKHLLRLRGEGRLAGLLNSEKAWQNLLANPQLQDRRSLLALHADLWRQTQTARRQLEEELLQTARPFEPIIDLLRSVPGVGPLVAITFIAALGDPRRFADSGRVVSYAGLAVSTYDSGERTAHGHITKSGNGELRAMLCEAAQHAWRPTHPLNPYYRRLTARRGYQQAIIAVAQRLARILWRMWLNEEPFKLDKLTVERTGRIQTRVVHYELRNRPPVASRSAA
jgi:transposase